MSIVTTNIPIEAQFMAARAALSEMGRHWILYPDLLAAAATLMRLANGDGGPPALYHRALSLPYPDPDSYLTSTEDGIPDYP